MRSALPGFAIAWALGILAADRAWLGSDAGAVGLTCRVGALLALALGTLFEGRARIACAWLSALALGAHAMAGRQADAAWTLPEARVEGTLEARVVEVAPMGHLLRVDLAEAVFVDRPERAPDGARLFVRLPAPGFAALAAGDRLRARVRLRRPVGLCNPGSADSAERLRRAGIGALAAPVHADLQVRLRLGGLVQSWRRAAQRRRSVAADRLRAAGAPLAAALALGDRSGLTDADREALRELGLAHLLAVSGLHVALVGGFGFSLARAVFVRSGAARLSADPRRPALAVALGVAVLYALLAGWGVPVRRALVFLAALGVGFALRRPVSRVAPLALAAVVVLAASPEALFEAGAQLSFAASAALLLARSPEGDPRTGLRGALLRSIGVSSLALAATAPLAAWHFGRAAPVALATNLVAVPLTGVLVLPGSLLAAGLALSGIDAAWAGSLLEAAGKGSSVLLAAARAAAGWVPAEASRSPAAPLALAVAGASAICAVWTRSERSRVAGAMLGALALALIPPPELQPARPRVLFMDVGQGDAALLQGSQGTILVDAGAADRGETVVLRALAAAGVRSVDLAVLTHADLDHRGGLTSVLGGIAVERLWLPRGAGTDPALLPLLEVARARGALVEERGAGDPPARIGDLLVTPLWPPAAGAGARNDRSLVVRVDTKESSVLFPGDIEARGERALLDAGVDLRADVLALPHHGSRSSSSTAFLTAVAPEVAVASAPCLGRFAMPAPEVAALLSERAATLWWTGRDGAVGVGLGRPRVVRGWRSAPLGFCR